MKRLLQFLSLVWRKFPGDPKAPETPRIDIALAWEVAGILTR